jgi:uncharacterized protein (TIGR02145 family)
LTGACAFAGENVLISRGTLEEASDAEVSNDVGRFLEGTNIASLSIEDYENREEVTVINRGKEYIFWIHFDPPICDDYYNEMAVFKNGRQVFYKDWEGQNDGDCNISGAGIVIEVPDSAPLGNYTWGARTTNSEGRDTYYPANFTIALPTQDTCGAFVAPGVWKEFDCYNLAAIGKTTNDDPFTPSWRLIGGYWQWGRKGPSSNQWHYTNTEHFAHGPTGPGLSEANEGEISGWDEEYAPDGSWSDSHKTANDPCPAGYRVPTASQWEGVIDNNSQSKVGTWESEHTNYSSARFFGNDLMLPAAGLRYSISGTLDDRGIYGYYWSSSESSSCSAWDLNFNSRYAGTNYNNRRYGRSVRCVAE